MVTLDNSVTADAGSDVSICAGSSTTLGASGGSSYSWSPTTALDDPSIAAPTANHTSTLTYTVTATGSNGCTDTDDVIVTVNSLPTASASSSTSTVCVGATVSLTGSASGGAPSM